MNPNPGNSRLPAETKPEPEPPLEIEIEGEEVQLPEPKPETPPPAAVKPPVAAQEEEEDDSQYGAKVQKRIKQLRATYYQERTAKERIERERDEAVNLIRQARAENEALRAQIRTGEGVLIDQVLQRAQAQIATAKENY